MHECLDEVSSSIEHRVENQGKDEGGQRRRGEKGGIDADEFSRLFFGHLTIRFVRAENFRAHSKRICRQLSRMMRPTDEKRKGTNSLS